MQVSAFSPYLLTQECQKIKSLCILYDWATNYCWFKVAGKYDVHVKKGVCSKSQKMEQGIKSQVDIVISMIVNTMNDVNQLVSNYEDQISNLQKEVKELRQNASVERQGFNSKLTINQNRNDNLTEQLQLSSQRQEVAQLEKKILKLQEQLKRSEENNQNKKRIILQHKDELIVQEIRIKNQQQKFNKLTVEFRNYREKMQDFLQSNNINPESLLKNIKYQNKLIKVPSEKSSELSSRSFTQPNIPKLKDRQESSCQSDPWVLQFEKSDFIKKRT